MIGKIKCFFGFHDYGVWTYLGYIGQQARICSRDKCMAVEIRGEK